MQKIKIHMILILLVVLILSIPFLVRLYSNAIQNNQDIIHSVEVYESRGLRDPKTKLIDEIGSDNSVMFKIIPGEGTIDRVYVEIFNNSQEVLINSFVVDFNDDQSRSLLVGEMASDEYSLMIFSDVEAKNEVFKHEFEVVENG